MTIFTAELWAAFDDNLKRQPSLQQNFGSLWWQSLLQNFGQPLIAILRQPSLQQNFGSLWWQSLLTVFTLGDVWWQSWMTVFNGNAFFERTLRGRFREKTPWLNSCQFNFDDHWQVETLARQDGVFKVTFDQCRVGLTVPGGSDPIKKRTTLLTNS